MHTERPAWLAEWCPVWCSGDHGGQELPDDRRHQSTAAWWTELVQRRQVLPSGEVSRVVEPTEMAVIAVQQVGEAQPWVAVTTDVDLLELTPEGARRLHAELGSLLDRLEEGRRGLPTMSYRNEGNHP